MFDGPAWILRRVSCGSSPERSYATSSGPKQCSQTNLASSGYRSPHSLHFNASTGIARPPVVSAACPVTEAWSALSHLDGLGTVSADCGWLPGFHRAMSLHPSRCERLCVVRRIQPPTRKVESVQMIAPIDDP